MISKRTFGSELIVAGLVGLAVSTLLTGITYAFELGWDGRGFGKLIALWGLTVFTLLVGLGVRFHEWLSDPDNRVLNPARVPDTAAPQAAGGFGRRRSMVIGAMPEPAATERWADSRAVFERHVDLQKLLDEERLDEAVARVESMIADSGATELIEAANLSRSVRIDWLDLASEAIEADNDLFTSYGEQCRLIDFQIGNFSEDALNIYRYYGTGTGERPRDAGAYRAFGFTEDIQRIDGMDELAALEQLTTPPIEPIGAVQKHFFLTHHLATLRFFQAVWCAATDDGLPFPVRLRVETAPTGGPEGYRALRDSLTMWISPRVTPLSARLETRLAERNDHQRERYLTGVERSLRHFRETYEERGYVESRFIPETLADDKARFRHIEDRLLVSEPSYRIPPLEFADLCRRMRRAGQAQAPQPVDVARYR